MEENYIVECTVFSINHGYYITKYEHFVTLEQAKNFVKSRANTKGYYMIYKSIKEEEK